MAIMRKKAPKKKSNYKSRKPRVKPRQKNPTTAGPAPTKVGQTRTYGGMNITKIKKK